jgi:predicted RNA-binding Zn-ribbon protein involved in translation (DUF1610 family)
VNLSGSLLARAISIKKDANGVITKITSKCPNCGKEAINTYDKHVIEATTWGSCKNCKTFYRIVLSYSSNFPID